MKELTGYDRTFTRYRVNFPACITPVTEAPPAASSPSDDAETSVAGLVYNVSLSGVGFVCSGLYEKGDQVQIEITLAARTYFVQASVRWRQQVERPGKPSYRYGAQFARTEATLQFIPVLAEYLRARG